MHTATRGNLPRQLTRFVGREDDLDRIRQVLESERLLTLTGTGGIGKTRLAIELAGRRREQYRDGAWLIDLGSVSEPDLVALAVAAPLGVRTETDVPVQGALLDFLHTRHLLLVLDNCEHLIEACAYLADAVLRVSPEVSILATSREPLHIPGERTWRVAALPEADGVRLFADRALAASGLRVGELDTAEVVRVCQQVDGIPLAIELAAARTGVLSVGQIASRLDDRFRLLVGGGHGVPARQQTLRAMLDWSYELLPEAERRLLDCLSVFAGGWTLEAAERVAADSTLAAAEPVPAHSTREAAEPVAAESTLEGAERVGADQALDARKHVAAEPTAAGDDVLERLARLVDRSLVQTEPGPLGHLRYRLLDTVRAYAAERLREGTHAVRIQQRHAACYLALAATVETHVLWGPNGLDWLIRLDREAGNLRAALGWSLSESGDPHVGLRLAGHLGHYWYTRGDRSEGYSWLTRLLARAAAPSAPSEQSEIRTWAWAVLWAGGLAHGRSDYQPATHLVGQAMRAFERLGDQRGLGWCLHFLGHVARARAELVQAADLLEAAVAAFRLVDDEISVSLPLAALGFTVCLLGEQARAAELCEQAVSVARRTGASGRLAIALIYQGQVAGVLGESRRAADSFREGLRLSREWDSAWGMAECLEGLAVVAGGDRQPERAARLLGAAARLREAIGAPVHPVDRKDHEQVVAQSQAALGAAAYAEAWANGAATNLDAVIEDASVSTDPEVAPRTDDLAQLTAREREVAMLIARGLSNRQIAETLVIAERTVTNHVEHIFDKLGFRSRAQVATWITQRQVDVR